MQCYADRNYGIKTAENAPSKKVRDKFSASKHDFGYSQDGNTNFFSDVTVQRAAAPSFKNEAVVQCWKTKSLEEDTCPSSFVRSGLKDDDPKYAVGYKLEELRGFGLSAAQEDGAEDIDEYSTNGELCEFLSDKDRADMMYYSKLSMLQDKRLAGTVHHMLSRKKLNDFYDQYCAEVKDDSDENKKRTQRRDAIMRNFANDQDSGSDPRSVLLSMRSNLVLGPDAAKRTDDPAHMMGSETDFDATGGDYSEISDIYKAIDAELSQPESQRGDPDAFFKGVLEMMITAQQKYIDIQLGKGLHPYRLNLDIESLWEEDANHKFRKKPRQE